MGRIVIVLLFALAACGGKGDSGTACKVDADCDPKLRCGLLQTPDGEKRTMCVDPNGVWDVSKPPKDGGGMRTPILIGVAGGVLAVLLLMLRSSVRAREQRKQRKKDA